MKELTDLEKIDLFFKYCKELSENAPKLVFNFSTYYKFYTYLVNLCDANKFPQVVEDKEFEALNSTKLYRGVVDIEHHANLLSDYDYHYGYGMYGGGGLYMSDDRIQAMRYARRNPENILTLKFDGKVIDEKELGFCLDYLEYSIKGEKYEIEKLKIKIANSQDEQLIKLLIDYYKQLKTDKDFIKNSPYSDAIKDSLTAIFLRDSENSIDLETSVNPEDIKNVNIEDETVRVYMQTRTLLDSGKLETTEKIRVLQTQTNLLEKQLSLQERAKNLRYVKDLENALIKVCKNLPEEGRLEILQILKNS